MQNIVTTNLCCLFEKNSAMFQSLFVPVCFSGNLCLKQGDRSRPQFIETNILKVLCFERLPRLSWSVFLVGVLELGGKLSRWVYHALPATAGRHGRYDVNSVSFWTAMHRVNRENEAFFALNEWEYTRITLMNDVCGVALCIILQ